MGRFLFQGDKDDIRAKCIKFGIKMVNDLPIIEDAKALGGFIEDDKDTKNLRMEISTMNVSVDEKNVFEFSTMFMIANDLGMTPDLDAYPYYDDIANYRDAIRKITETIAPKFLDKNYSEPIFNPSIKTTEKLDLIYNVLEDQTWSDGLIANPHGNPKIAVKAHIISNSYRIAEILADYKPKYFNCVDLFPIWISERSDADAFILERRNENIKPLIYLFMATYIISLNRLQNILLPQKPKDILFWNILASIYRGILSPDIHNKLLTIPNYKMALTLEFQRMISHLINHDISEKIYHYITLEDFKDAQVMSWIYGKFDFKTRMNKSFYLSTIRDKLIQLGYRLNYDNIEKRFSTLDEISRQLAIEMKEDILSNNIQIDKYSLGSYVDRMIIKSIRILRIRI